MKRIIAVALIAFGGMATSASAQDTLTGNLTQDSTLPANSCFYLEDCFVVKAGYTLTIEAGVHVLARTASSLIIEPGAQLVVNGVSNNPVIFTSAEDPGDRAPGDWYGIVIGGLSYTNNGPLDMGSCTNVVAGGIFPDDNSGTIRYLQVHFAGGDTRSKLDNGFTLNAVGDGTVIEHVEVTNSASNNFGIYGGTVHMSYLFSLDARRNDFLFSDGYAAKSQFLLAIRKDPGAYHATDPSYGILIQNNTNIGSGFTGAPLTAPVISNATVTGPDACNDGPFDGDFRDAIRFHQNGAGSVYNSFFEGWPGHGLYIDGGQSVAHTSTNALNFSYNSFYNNGTAYGSSTWSGGCSGSMADWIDGTGIICPEDGNQTGSTDPAYDASLCGDYCDEMYVANFVLDDIVTELDPPDFGWPGGDTWFNDAVDFRGAIQETDLYTEWSELCPQEEPLPCIENEARTGYTAPNAMRLSPNPTSGNAYATFEAKAGGTVFIHILDQVSGHPVRSAHSEVAASGEQRITVPSAGLPAGVYVVRILLPDGSVLTGQLLVH